MQHTNQIAQAYKKAEYSRSLTNSGLCGKSKLDDLEGTRHRDMKELVTGASPEQE